MTIDMRFPNKNNPEGMSGQTKDEMNDLALLYIGYLKSTVDCLEWEIVALTENLEEYREFADRWPSWSDAARAVEAIAELEAALEAERFWHWLWEETRLMPEDEKWLEHMRDKYARAAKEET